MVEDALNKSLAQELQLGFNVHFKRLSKKLDENLQFIIIIFFTFSQERESVQKDSIDAIDYNKLIFSLHFFEFSLFIKMRLL